MRRAAWALCALALAGCLSPVADAPIEQWEALSVEALPVEFPGESVGLLRFRGGVELRLHAAEGDEPFGGLSGLEVLDGERFVAVSDVGTWVEGDLVLDESGALKGVAHVREAQMRDENGRPFRNKEAADAEGLAQLPDGRFAVSFEQTQTIRIYDLNRDGPFGAARAGPSLAGVQSLPGNAGLEALAATADGTLLVGAEGGETADAPLWIARLDASAPASASARYPLPRAYSLTSLDRLPDGGFVALERFYAPIVGPRARISRFSLPASEHGEVSTEELARLEPPMPIDNFEAVSAVRGPDGAVRLYILSDNNLSDRQRTLLLAFDIVEPLSN